MQTLLKLVGAIVVLALIAVWYLASNVDSIVKQIIEEVGTETVTTEVSVGGVKISLGSEASAQVSNLTIANLPGYTQPYLFELGDIFATIAAGSLAGEVVVIPQVQVADAQLTFEQQEASSNLQMLLKRMDAESADSDEGAAADEQLIAIAELTLAAVGVTVISDQLERPVSFVLDTLVIRDIGTPARGVTTDQATDLMVRPVIDAALLQAKQQVREIIEAQVRAELDKKKEEATEDLKQSLRDKLRVR